MLTPIKNYIKYYIVDVYLRPKGMVETPSHQILIIDTILLLLIIDDIRKNRIIPISLITIFVLIGLFILIKTIYNNTTKKEQLK